MKYLLNLGESSPLTLGMGHPIEHRLKSLQHANRSKKFLPATIGAALLLTSTISSVNAKTDEIVRDVAAPIVSTIVKPVEEMAVLPTEQEPDQTAQFAPKPIGISQRPSGLKPMRLRMSPYFTTAQLDAFTASRKRLIKNDSTASGAFDGEYINVSYYNRFEVVVKDSGQALMNISRGTGGWPGYPANNTQWDTRPLSAKMQKGMVRILDRCARSSGPVYFLMPITDGDEDMGRGDFEIQCTPGSEAVQKRTKRRALAQAWLASDDIRLERRQSNMDWIMSFALIGEHVAKTQGASIEKDRAACVKIHTLIKEKYTFSDTDRASQDAMIAKCATKDYNWVRRRENIPEVQ